MVRDFFTAKDIRKWQNNIKILDQKVMGDVTRT